MSGNMFRIFSSTILSIFQDIVLGQRLVSNVLGELWVFYNLKTVASNGQQIATTYEPEQLILNKIMSQPISSGWR